MQQGSVKQATKSSRQLTPERIMDQAVKPGEDGDVHFTQHREAP